MQTLEQATKRASGLYWLAFLLTGHRGLSVDVTLEALEALVVPDDANPFFSVCARNAWVSALKTSPSIALKGPASFPKCRSG